MLEAQPAAEVSLRRSHGGVFDILVDGRLVFSKSASGRFPSRADILAALAV